ncbi:hypothetical protein GCM10022278_37780 [Allohahella marinimesophila]|uniref:Uncharacterized protein n=1 Tax=Allohahella marinimesophila TaxID=1054972 RepID=A0ABP7Q7A5_9GAMM
MKLKISAVLGFVFLPGFAQSDGGSSDCDTSDVSALWLSTMAVAAEDAVRLHRSYCDPEAASSLNPKSINSFNVTAQGVALAAAAESESQQTSDSSKKLTQCLHQMQTPR